MKKIAIFCVLVIGMMAGTQRAYAQNKTQRLTVYGFFENAANGHIFVSRYPVVIPPLATGGIGISSTPSWVLSPRQAGMDKGMASAAIRVQPFDLYKVGVIHLAPAEKSVVTWVASRLGRQGSMVCEVTINTKGYIVAIQATTNYN